MGFGSCNYSALKTNLRLAINRFKLLEKKKTELALKARKEIADYIQAGKEDRARIRVEHIVREDYLVEAMEILELYCDLLLARFGIIQSQKTMDLGLETAIASILWACPKLQADVGELKHISDQFTAKYGKEFAQASRGNTLENVDEKLTHKLSVHSPPKLLIEKYMIEIARSYNIPFVPDPMIMAEDEVYCAEGALIGFNEKGGGGGGFGNGSGGGFGNVGGGGFGSGGGGGGGGHMAAQVPGSSPYPPQSTGAPLPPAMPPVGNFPPAGGVHAPPFTMPQPGAQASGGTPLPGMPGRASAPPPQDESPPPGYSATQPPNEMKRPEVTFPDLPSVPTNKFPPPGGATHTPPGANSTGEDVDFDDLTRRFQQLKKRN